MNSNCIYSHNTNPATILLMLLYKSKNKHKVNIRNTLLTNHFINFFNNVYILATQHYA